MSFALNCWGDNIQKQGNVTLHEIGRTGRVESESREKSGPPRQLVPAWHDHKKSQTLELISIKINYIIQ